MKLGTLTIILSSVAYHLAQGTVSTSFGGSSFGCQAQYYNDGFNYGCRTCNRGYFKYQSAPNTWACRECARSCEECQNDSVCQVCKPGYYLTSNLLCDACSSGCERCLNPFSCTKCKEAHFLDATSKCQKCNTGCKDCNNAVSCVNCASEFFKNNLETCSACSGGCLKCTNETTCQDCKWGYSLGNGVCVEHSPLVKILSVAGIIAVIGAIIAAICWCASGSGQNNQSHANQNQFHQPPNQQGNWNNANQGWNNQQGGWDAQGGNNGRVELARNSYNQNPNSMSQI